MICNSMEKVQQAKHIREQFADRFHLVENAQRAQFVDLHQVSQTSHAATWFEVLGTGLGAPSADVGKSKRIQARFKRPCALLCFLKTLPANMQISALSLLALRCMAGSLGMFLKVG